MKPKQESRRIVWWYTARVENRTGIHGVFYGTVRPITGGTCDGVAAPNKVIGYRREPATYTAKGIVRVTTTREVLP